MNLSIPVFFKHKKSCMIRFHKSLIAFLVFLLSCPFVMPAYAAVTVTQKYDIPADCSGEFLFTEMKFICRTFAPLSPSRQNGQA